MIEQFQTMQKFSRMSVERVLTTQATASKAFAAIATETAAYAKKSVAEGKAALEQLSTVKALDKALEIQTGYLKSAHEGFVAQTRKSPSSMPVSRKMRSSLSPRKSSLRD